MDKITIKDLEVQTNIGVTAAERAHTQRLLITVVLERDLAEAGRTDMESSTTPYDVVASLVKQVVAQRPRKLVEAVADEIDRKSTRLNSSHTVISYAVFCLKKKTAY